MKKILLFSLLVPFSAIGQILNVDQSTLHFNTVLVGEKDSLEISIHNPSGDSIFVNNLKFYSVYNEFPFSASLTSFGLASLDTQKVWIYFEPIQNVLHNSELIIQHNAKSGFSRIDIWGQGRFPRTYYDTTENLAEEDLKKALKWKLAQNYSQLTYNNARDEMYHVIDNQNASLPGKVECVYTGTIKNYANRSAVQSSSAPGMFNTEHTFPQSTFNQILPERSDIHHLFPTTNNSNSQRGSKPFGKVTGGTASGGGSFYNSTTYEPRNKQKGKTARAMMYFVIRYKDYANHFSTQENILRSWHTTYPPDSLEEARNKDIFAVQRNRNPFIDYPQLEERITNFISNSSAPSIFALDILQTSINFGKITTQQADTFNYILVNRGNKTINFSNLALSDTNMLSFVDSAGVDRSIAAGDAIEIKVRIQTTTTGIKSENLTFDTNMPGSQSSFTIPIRANSLLVSLSEISLNEEMNVFPNPMNNRLNVQSTFILNNYSMIMYDAVGRNIPIKIHMVSDRQFELNTEQLEKGIYFLSLSNGHQHTVKKLIK